LLDFWATWCPPCQDPMHHNHEMIDTHREDPIWSKVRIIGLSCNGSPEEVAPHIEEHGMTNPEHYQGADDAKAAFGVSGIPFCALVDKQGTIVWTGHPGSVDLESKITELASEGNEAPQ